MRHKEFRMTIYPFAVLLILDGWGEAPFSQTNAIKMAQTPHLDRLYDHSFHTLLQASGEAVGLPEGIIGNSEVGHLNIGAGRVVLQEVLRINQEIKNGMFFRNHTFLDGIESAKTKGKNIHIVGLCTNALVHSSIDHLFALLKLCADQGYKDNVYIHVITDGRDTPIDASYKYINQIQQAIQTYGVGKIATVMGRYYAMDRDERWDRIKKAYDAMVAQDNTTQYYPTPLEGIRKNANEGRSDEFIIPFRVMIDQTDKMKGLVKEGDTVIFFNFREDRPRQLTEAFVQSSFEGFSRNYFPTHFITMTEYARGLCEHIAYQKETVNETISKVLSDKGLPEFKIAETEKYAHVTYFFNGGREVAYPLEDRFLIPSLKIPTYDLKPQMRAYEIADELMKRIKEEKYKLLIANFANADMVGHTGNLEATIKACECVDEAVGRVAKQTFAHGGLLVVTADHGNAEIKYDRENKEVSTRHTTSPVPLIIASKETDSEEHLQEGKLADIAPTILNRIGLDRGYDMNGTNLLA